MNLFTFDESPWDLAVEKLKRGGKMSASRFLTLLEQEEEEVVEDAFQTLDEMSVALDIEDLPKPAGTGEAAARLHREQQLVQQGKLESALEDNDPLRLYLQELADIPVCGDPQVLAMECAAGKESAREQLLNLSLSQVVNLAEEFVGRGVLLLDLIQEGSMGLWQAILNYRDGDFEPHRDWWIRQYMSKAVVNQARANGVGQKMRQELEDYRSVDERLLGELGRNPTLEEIAEQMHISVEQAQTVADMMDNIRMLNRVEKAVAPKKEEEDPEDEQAVEDTAYFHMRQRILDLLSSLSQEDAQLLTLRFGLEGGLPLSPAETGKKLGMSPEDVIEREAAALGKLRQS